MKVGEICNANECIEGQFYKYEGIEPYSTLSNYTGEFYCIGDNNFYITKDDGESQNTFKFFYSRDNSFKRVRKPTFITNPIVLKLIRNDKR